jgi:transketolase
VIGFGAPNKQNTAKAHGAALGPDEVQAARAALDWKFPPFEIPPQIYAGWDARARGGDRQKAWNDLFQAYSQQYSQEAGELARRIRGELPPEWPAIIASAIDRARAADKPVATRKASENTLNLIAPSLPEFVGGSADLTESNLTLWHGAKVAAPGDLSGQYLFYGVREFGMCAAMNGMAVHGGVIPFGGSFLVFSDYARNAVRMSALMKQRVIFVFTHDSIGLGEDGPTHQPIEHVSALRLIPNMRVWRPADAFETAIAWRAAVERTDGPSVLALSRQNLPPQAHADDHVALAARGGYVLWQPAAEAQLVIMATGSEVALSVDAAKALAQQGVHARVVSLPCVELFLAQDADYRDSVLPPGIKRLAVEAGVTAYWRGWADDVVGIDRFGESAPLAAVMKFFGFTTENIVGRARRLLA